jgi:uncharacterized protein YllA (UPF0747 family)
MEEDFQMENPMFNNDILEQWLEQKSQEILNKIQREHITTEDMIILLLKAQVNHFHHMDSEFRDEFKKIDRKFEYVDRRFEEIHKKFDYIDKRFEEIEKRFDYVDKRFDRLTTILMWGFGLFVSTQVLTLIKLFS